SLLQGFDGNFYGSTVSGGKFNAGTIFKISPSGTLTTLYTFCGACGDDVVWPFGGMVQGTDGNLYGTTGAGGNSDDGIVFKMTPSGSLTPLYNFDSNSGAQPYGDLIQATDGNFYGTTSRSGNNGSGYGTVFKITSAGSLSALHTFDDTDGA